jgi:cytochrome c oxidase subunit 2
MIAPRCLLIAMALLLASCTGQQSALDVHGTSAIQLKHLVIGIVAVCSLVWMLVMVVMILALVRRRDDRLDLAPSNDRRLVTAVIGATVATIFIITGFTVASFHTTRALNAPGGDLTILVRGQQWWWDVTYLDPDSSRSFKTANEIRIPVGKSVRLQLEAGDVIHSFWVPSLAGKLDLIPGRKNELTIRAEHAGIYRGQCAEFCGMQHTHMAVFVVAEEGDAFETWARSQRASSMPPDDADARAGQSVFLAKPCAACHTVRGTAATGTTGPDLTHVGSRLTIAAGLSDNTRGAVAAWIADPQTLKPGNNMPMVSLGSDELKQLSAYMVSLK